MGVESLRICIDPELTKINGPEIHWTWRLLLSGIGWAWEEAGLDDPCEVAYLIEPTEVSQARLCIQANPDVWNRPAAYRLEKLERRNGLAYLRFTGEPVLTEPIHVGGGRVVCQRDLIFDVFWLATGQEERYWPKNEHGFMDLTDTTVLHEQLPRRAIASQISLWLEKKLVDLGCHPPKPRWPDGKRAAASVGHDVDYPEVKRLIEPLRIIKRLGVQNGLGPALDILTGRRTHWHFDDWIELERRLQTCSAFYFVPRQGSVWEYATGTPDPFYDISSKRFRELFSRLSDAGFEIGLHASYRAYQDREKFAAEKAKLEEVSGQLISGGRHHYWHLNPTDVEETLLIHEQIGLKYDASLVHERYLGYRRGLSQPFFPFYQNERRELQTLQIPTSWMDDQVFGWRMDNLGNRQAILRYLADHTADQGGCLLIDIHDYVFDDTLFPGWTQTFRRLWEHLLVRGDFWFATPAQISEHWIARYKSIVQASYGLNEGLA